MTILPVCPSCGLESPEVRCPRCNALKAIGCSGACTMCGSKKTCSTGSAPAGTARPSDEAREDEEHPGTPLER
ncbi:MAG: hypothetical protein U1E26_02075 [Coriobacteriia bacterium]|nr:hypothetical protein [Coriobacteriia bacterium]